MHNNYICHENRNVLWGWKGTLGEDAEFLQHFPHVIDDIKNGGSDIISMQEVLHSVESKNMILEFLERVRKVINLALTAVTSIQS